MYWFVREQVAIYLVPDYFQRKGQDFVANKETTARKNKEKPNTRELKSISLLSSAFTRGARCHKAVLLKPHPSNTNKFRLVFFVVFFFPVS